MIVSLFYPNYQKKERMERMTEKEVKEQMCEIGRRVYDRGMVAANDGNFSVKLNEHEYLCTPTGVSKGFMTPDFICKVDENCEVLEANPGFKPSHQGGFDTPAGASSPHRRA